MGLIYYKLQSKYSGDVTKNCGVSSAEIDGNFYFLRGYDIEDAYLDVEGDSINLKRVNGEEIVISGLSEYFQEIVPSCDVDLSGSTYDSETGVLTLVVNGECWELEGFYTPSANTIYTDEETIVGNGTEDNPLMISPSFIRKIKFGVFAPVENIVDGLSECEIHDGVRYLVTGDTFYIAEWDGEKWIKTDFTEGCSVIVKDYDETYKNVEVALYEGNIVKKYGEIEDSINDLNQSVEDLNEATEEISNTLEEQKEIISGVVETVSDVVDKVNEFGDVLNSEIEERKNSENEIWSAMTETTEQIYGILSGETEEIQNISDALSSETQNRINADNELAISIDSAYTASIEYTDLKVKEATNSGVTSEQIEKIWVGTEEQYNEMESHSDKILYIIK